MFGETGIAFFDYWFLAHLSFWFFMGSTLAALKLPRIEAGVASLIGALLWEIFERFAEKQWPQTWQSPESFLNAWISDPLTCIVGLVVAWWGFDKWRTKSQ